MLLIAILCSHPACVLTGLAPSLICARGNPRVLLAPFCNGVPVRFQAYLDNIRADSGKLQADFKKLADQAGF
ncbi:MAG: hypothetical protein JWP47_498 [Polaromonas sp.]|jgi:hypothetical protein|nr:hypothetical protein [Polaromonas sp.]